MNTRTPSHQAWEDLPKDVQGQYITDAQYVVKAYLETILMAGWRDTPDADT